MHVLYKSFSAAAIAASMLALPTSCASSPRDAHAEAPPAPPLPPRVARTVEVEINDTPPGGAAKSAVYSLAVVDDNGWSRIESKAPAAKLSLMARSDRERGGPAIVRLDVQRLEAAGPDLLVSQAVIFWAGRRTVIGKLARGDGGTTEIAMTTR